jgi:hypothetical protein
MSYRTLLAAVFALLASCPTGLSAQTFSLKEVTWLSVSPGSRAYFVDARSGSDSNDGTAGHPWQTIDRVNHTRFAPGDRITFTGGQTFKGTLRFVREESGTANRPITLRSTRSTSRQDPATLDGGADNGIELTDCSYITVRDLKIVGCGRKNGSDGAGIHLVRTSNVTVRAVDISGFRNGGVSTEGDANTQLIAVITHDNGSAGITVDGGYDAIPRVKNLLIRDCRADNNPGDPKNLTNHSGNGIVVGGVDGVLIEYCEASNNGWDMPRDGNGPVGIWGWNCDRLTIQHCISHDNKSPGTDGGGFDFDGGVTNSILQYNLSYHNMGCGYLLCQFPGASRWRHNVMRYNISVDDGTKNFHSGIGLWIGGGDFSDAEVYNNTIINREHAVSTLGEVPGFVYRNNIFLTGSHVLDATQGGSYAKSRFAHNLYWSTGNAAIYRDEKTAYTTLAEWAAATGQETTDGMPTGLQADPELALPEDTALLPTLPARMRDMPAVRLLPGTPAIHAGVEIPANGGYDYAGHRLAPHQKPALGARELQ